MNFIMDGTPPDSDNNSNVYDYGYDLAVNMTGMDGTMRYIYRLCGVRVEDAERDFYL